MSREPLHWGHYPERYKHQPKRICPTCNEVRSFIDNDNVYSMRKTHDGHEWLWFWCECGIEKIKMIDMRGKDLKDYPDGVI